jgi:hypothetical protein
MHQTLLMEKLGSGTSTEAICNAVEAEVLKGPFARNGTAQYAADRNFIASCRLRFHETMS